LSIVRTVTIEVAVQVELDKINHSSSETSESSVPLPRTTGGTSGFPDFLFPVPQQCIGGGDFCKIFALFVPEKLFWGGYLKEIG
jgi:hypothetical protein